jgi:hypothetical protein
VRVKGRQQPVGIFEPLGPVAASEDVLEELALYCHALYREQDWVAAGE